MASGGCPPSPCGDPEQSPWIPWTPPYAQDPYMGSTPPMGAIRRPMGAIRRPMGAIGRPVAAVRPFNAGHQRPLPALQMGPEAYPRYPIRTPCIPRATSPRRAANRPVAVVRPRVVERPPHGERSFEDRSMSPEGLGHFMDSLPPSEADETLGTDPSISPPYNVPWWMTPPSPGNWSPIQEQMNQMNLVTPPRARMRPYRSASPRDQARIFERLLTPPPRMLGEREYGSADLGVMPLDAAPPEEWLEDEPDPDWGALPSREASPCGGIEDPRFQTEYSPIPPEPGPFDEEDSPGQGWWRDDHIAFNGELSPQDGWWNAGPGEPEPDWGALPSGQASPCGGLEWLEDEPEPDWGALPSGGASPCGGLQWLEDEPEPDWGALPSGGASPCGGLQDPRFPTEYSPIPPEPGPFDEEDSPGQGWWRDDHIPFNVELSPRDGWWNARPGEGEAGARRRLSFC